MNIDPANWERLMAELRHKAVAGDVASMTQLALNLADGIQDVQGRSLVRRNPRYAFQLLRRAADLGDVTAAGALGFAYDVGQGTRANEALALKWYRWAAQRGNWGSASNIATIYRDRGDLKSAHRWALRALELGDGDAAVTAGYNWLYGIGVHADVKAARRMFRLALRRAVTTVYGREEALYNLAIVLVDSGKPRQAIPLLKQAAADGDYPEAESLLSQIEARAALRPCRCRRHLHKNLRGHAQCPQHPRR
jgi:TPR repeat protein